MKEKNSITKNQTSLLKWISIGIALLFFWFLAGILYTSFGSFLVLSDNFTFNSYQHLSTNKLLKGQILYGEITATENNLGIVSFRLLPGSNVHSEQDDLLLFRLKEKNSSHWYYTKIYKSGALRGFTFFPIGFPVIPDSKGKTYQFEITSLKGNYLNAITILKKSPVIIAKYQFTKNDFLQRRENPVHFILKKSLYFLSDQDDLAISSIFFVPFILYLAWVLSIKFKILREKALFLITLFAIFFQLIFYGGTVYGIILGLVMLWIVVLYKDRLSSDYSFLLSFCIFLIGEVAIFLQQNAVEVESAFLVYSLLLVGVSQLVWEIKKRPKNRLSITHLKEFFTPKHSN